jgi:hypothetical protein
MCQFLAPSYFNNFQLLVQSHFDILVWNVKIEVGSLFVLAETPAEESAQFQRNSRGYATLPSSQSAAVAPSAVAESDHHSDEEVDVVAESSVWDCDPCLLFIPLALPLPPRTNKILHLVYTHTHTICRLSSVRQPGGPTCHQEHTKTHTLWNKMLLQVLWIKILDFSELESMPRDQNNENFQRAFYTNLMWELICYTEAEHHSAVIATVCFWLFPHVNDVNY